MTKGYVYILKNPSMPGILKIGKTTRSVEQRCNELWQTGVPTPFEVAYQVSVPDCHAAEYFVHNMLCEQRVSDAREFFKVDEKTARDALLTAQISQVYAIVEEYLPGYVITDPLLTLMADRVAILCEETGKDKETVTMAMNCVRAEEIAPALARINASNEKSKLYLAANNG